jgi:hypothetical protein
MKTESSKNVGATTEIDKDYMEASERREEDKRSLEAGSFIERILSVAG